MSKRYLQADFENNRTTFLIEAFGLGVGCVKVDNPPQIRSSDRIWGVMGVAFSTRAHYYSTNTHYTHTIALGAHVAPCSPLHSPPRLTQRALRRRTEQQTLPTVGAQVADLHDLFNPSNTRANLRMFIAISTASFASSEVGWFPG
jgi:hypothetical protein